MQSAVPTSPAALVGFSRPHTVIGTTVSVTALYLLAWLLPVGAHPSPPGLGLALLAGLAVNVYIVGLNQLTDIDLDRINKPWLPLPARTLSVRAARRIVAGSALVALAAAIAGSGWLLAAIVAAIALGTAYSVPPVRAKRYHVAAAACIVTVRGLVVNLLVFAHFAGPRLPPAIVTLAAVVTLLALAIAWFKDLPDMDGDRQFTVGTLPLRVGARRVLWLGVTTLVVAYLGVAAAGLSGLEGLDRAVMALGHVGLAAALLRSARRVRLDEPVLVARFYRGIWTLFYAEYGLFVAAAALA